MKELFNNLFFEPLYNGLVFLVGVIPGGNVGVAVIILTVIVKFILFPLSIKAVRTQAKMKVVQKPLEDIRKKYDKDREAMGKAMLALYKEHKINPFSSFFLILLQIPVIFALYWVFLRGGLPNINMDILYSFISVPAEVSMHFLGSINVGESKSVLLALLAAGTQFYQAKFSFPKIEEPKDGEKSLKNDMMKGMSFQIKYILPVIIFFISYTLVSAVALYWTVSNLFAIGQELYVRKNIKNKEVV
ncbi:MAG: YidC/Oxa1 family membrane protein insertase [Candidatus Paceibacteria bacterium]|jgi:YidC/Oxa1 family membrane protein insertase